MAVICVDQCLEVAHLDQLTTVFCALDQRVLLHGVLGILGQELLNILIVKQLVLSKSQNFEGLFFCYEAAFNS